MSHPIEDADYFIRVVPFDNDSADGAVALNPDGTYSIYINANVSDARQRAALKHEIRHIELDHFYSDKPLAIIEAEADGKVTPKPVKEELPPHLIWLDSWRRAMLWAEEQMRRKK